MVNVVNFVFADIATFAKGHCHNFGLALDKTTRLWNYRKSDYIVKIMFHASNHKPVSDLD